MKPKAVIAMLGAVVLMLSLYLSAQAARVEALEASVNAAYEKAFYETIELTGALEINLEKLIVSSDAARRQAILGVVARQAESAQENLASLPGVEDVNGALKLVNQTGDFARSLDGKLASGGAPTDGDLLTADTLRVYFAAINARLEQMRAQMEAGGTPFEGAILPRGEENVPEETGEETLAEYPVLLYDGPFSDGRQSALEPSGAKVSEEQAREAALEFIGRARVREMRFTGVTNVPAACYEFDAETDDGTLSVAVTQVGAHPLYMLTSLGETASSLSQASCVDAAALFLRTRGYEGMQVSYYQQNEGMLTVNFAATQDAVLLYPDLIKVQVNMKSGLVVGFEALNYLSNHRPRALPEPALSSEEAKRCVSPSLEVARARLCVIPTDAGEAYCYELHAGSGLGWYLIYIDANTGEERDILKILEDEGGQLAI